MSYHHPEQVQTFQYPQNNYYPQNVGHGYNSPNQMYTRPNKKHQCNFCAYASDRKPDVKRHVEKKHPGMGSVQPAGTHKYASNPHPYVHPYLNHANQQPNPYPQRTPEMVANNTYYAKETRAPTKISVGPNVQRAPTTISVPPQIGGVQDGSGIGGQFHRPSQNSFDVARHGNRAPTKYHEPGPEVRAPTTISIPPLISQTGAGIEEMDFKTNIEEEDNIWDIITNIHGELEYIQNLKKHYGELLPQLNELEGVLLDEALKEYATLEVKVIDEQYGLDPLENEAEEEGEDDDESRDVSEHFLSYIFELRDEVDDDDLELLELYTLQGSGYKEEEIDETDIEDLFIEIREHLESQQNLKIKFRNTLHQVKDLDRGWLKHTLKVYASLEMFVKEEVFGLKNDELEEEDIDSDTEEEENEEEEIEEEESEEEEVDDDEEEREKEPEESEKEESVGLGLEPFWDFVFKAREIVDDELEDKIDKYVRKETKRILKEKEKDEMEMDMDPEDHPRNSGEMFKDVLDITNEFEHSGPCCFNTCSKRTISSISKMTEFILDNKESLQAHNPKMFVKVHKMLLPVKRSVRKIGDRTVTSHRKRKILQSPQVGAGLLTFMEKLALPTFNTLF